LNGALYFRHGLEPVGDSGALADGAEAAFLRVLELAPDHVEFTIEYLEWLQMSMPPLGPLSGNFRPVLERALASFPDNERLSLLKEWLVQTEPELLFPTETPAATATLPPSATATAAPAPTATAQPVPTQTTAPAQRATPVATEAPKSDGGGICPGTLALALVPLGAVSISKRRRRV
jgi:hypothetical protein